MEKRFQRSAAGASRQFKTSSNYAGPSSKNNLRSCDAWDNAYHGHQHSKVDIRSCDAWKHVCPFSL